MYCVLFLSLVIIATTNCNVISTYYDGRIVGGEATTIEQFPYQVSVRYADLDWRHNCGGSILSPRVIISAAHCFKHNSSRYLIQYGSTEVNDGKRVKIARIDNHEGYNSSTMENDISIIHLAEDIVFGSNARPIALASKSPALGTHTVVSGWGRTETGMRPSTLQKVNGQIMDHSLCKNQYADLKKINPDIYEVNNDMICAGVYGGGKGTCSGDSGGPLVAYNELIGIVSWGNCSRNGLPGVLTNVARFRHWIDDKISRT